MNIPKFIRFWFPVCIYSGIIFYASSLQGVDIPVHVSNIDKFAHVFEYIPFGFLVARAFFNTGDLFCKKNFMILSIICSFLYGVSDEYHQLFVVTRDASILDILADTLGGIIGGTVFSIINSRTK
ncbi:MAG: VanZ family protein [Candidatus Omnitrophica bacterium]|nr:VanZ family protein [Candidatus Omnitrophota bacterium]MBU1996246.1 VanZ family protein [Candidatus Omnitrophota bacterium]